jgi:hypothetical protein
MLDLDLASQSANSPLLDSRDCSRRDQGAQPQRVWKVTSYLNPMAIGVLYLHLTKLEEFFEIALAW